MYKEDQINEIIKSLPEDQKRELLDFAKYLISKHKKTAKRTSFSDFAGILVDSPNFNENPLEVQKRLRNEWQ